MITHEEIEEFICQYPVYQYAFFPPEEIEFSFRVRWICEKECERYNSTWACPPAVGSVEECRKRCSYRECFLFSTIAEVSDVINFEKRWLPGKSTKPLPLPLKVLYDSRAVRAWPFPQNPATSANPAPFPRASCRFRKKCTPCVESHGNHRF